MNAYELLVSALNSNFYFLKKWNLNMMLKMGKKNTFLKNKDWEKLTNS